MINFREIWYVPFNRMNPKNSLMIMFLKKRTFWDMGRIKGPSEVRLVSTALVAAIKRSAVMETPTKPSSSSS